MAVFKVNLFFEGRRWGWSETYYAEYADVPAVVASTLDLIPLRVAMLGGDVALGEPRLKRFRISDVEIARDSTVRVVPPANGAPSTPIDTADNPNLALNVRCEAGPGYRRQLYLRGNPDKVVKNMIYVADADFIPRFGEFKTFMLTRQWGILGISVPAIPLAILNVVQDDGQRVVVSTVGNHGLSVGNTVRIVSAPGTTGVRGNRTVFSVNSLDSFTYIGTAIGLYRGGGTLYKRTPALKRFTNMEIEEVTHRITGGPTNRPVGRRRRRATV